MVSDDGGRTLRRLGERTSTSTITTSGSIRRTRITISSVATAASTRVSIAARLGLQTKPSDPQFYDITTDNAKPLQRLRRHAGQLQLWWSIAHAQRFRHHQRRLVCHERRRWFSFASRSGRSEYDLRGIAERRIVRFDKRTGERIGIQPQPGRGEDPYRWNWDSPFIISPHSRTRLYFAADKLFRSDDRGDSWQ